MKVKIDFFSDDLVRAIGAGVYNIIINKNGREQSLYIGGQYLLLLDVQCIYMN